MQGCLQVARVLHRAQLAARHDSICFTSQRLSCSGSQLGALHNRSRSGVRWRKPRSGQVVNSAQDAAANNPFLQHTASKSYAHVSHASVEAPASSAAKQQAPWVKSVLNTLIIVGLLSSWYGFNIFFNIYNKQVLSAFPYPVFCSEIHLLIGGAMMALLWLFKVRKAPKFNKSLVDFIMPLGILHMLGFLLTNMSLGAVNVSLTHTIKALEPFFTVVLSWAFMGTVPSLAIVMTLFPIVGGVIIASATDVSFNWLGFLTAMGSNLTFQSRNVLSKKYMVESSFASLEGGEEDNGLQSLDEMNLFACITIAAAVLLLSCIPVMEGSGLAATLSTHSGNPLAVMSKETWFRLVMAGICRFGDVLTSFAILQRVSPVTHSVGNCVKRVVVIAVSILFFRTPASFLNILGTAIALAAVFAYSMVQRAEKQRKDLKAALTAKELLQAFVPGFVLSYFEERRRREAARKQAELEAARKQQRGPATPDEDLEYFL